MVIFEINEIIIIIIIISRKVMVAEPTQNPFEIGQTMYIFGYDNLYTISIFFGIEQVQDVVWKN
jgi:hypothetical protein